MPSNLSLGILIPTRNRSRYLSELLFKLMPQTINHNVVVYVRDNDSDDDTGLIVESYQKQYVNLVYEKNPINIGMMANFLMLIHNCKEEYFWLFGDDDVIHDDGLNRVIHILQSQPDYVVLRDEDKSFNSLREFVLGDFSSNPYKQISSTLITCNIVKRNFFDLNFATTKYTSFYSHMYGIMMGLAINGGNVYSRKNEIFFHRGRDAAPPTDGDWPQNLELEWVRYLKFIARLVNIRYPFYRVKIICGKRRFRYLLGLFFKSIIGPQLAMKIKNILKNHTK